MQSEVHELRGPLLSSFNASDDHRGNDAVQITIGTKPVHAAQLRLLSQSYVRKETPCCRSFDFQPFSRACFNFPGGGFR
jgi:hypothetical protein